MRKTRFFTGIALLVLSTGGCGLAATSPGRDVMVPAEPTMIDFVDPATVVGLTTRTLTEGDSPGSRYVHINYPELMGARALNRALYADAERRLRDFRKVTGTTGDPRPELNVDWQLAAVTPQTVGVRLRTGEYLGASWGNSTRTYWFDQRNDKAVGSTGLLAGQGALERLATLVKEQFKGRGSQVDLNAVTGFGGRFDSMAFNRVGDLVVEFDDCQIGPCSLGRLAVAVPAAQVAPLLSGLGRRAQESVRAEAADAPHVAPRTMPPTSPDVVSTRAGKVDCARAKCVALTFDDGPGPDTGRLLDTLQRFGARATFFAVGSNAAAQPGFLNRMNAEGHLVGNHSWMHRDMSKQSSSKIADSLARTAAAVEAANGQPPTLMRPPYGAVSQDLANVARNMGLPLVGWDVDTQDEHGGDAADITDRVVRETHPTAIVLMHDINPNTVDAVPDILKRLRGKGYSFVTVPELYGSAGMQAGRLYGSGNELQGKQPLT
ncbi:polysaccharide deacetylase family protein [Nonomuraea sp. K274]|uniref:Polysaccharide deacetylase family protein n=1 Tax=Nonomuraea cypriaca TaxID=1187855 RepID=A0A931AL88_9ACTN|nr:polysaccharide deacetylase family protein [Nonomuraea cypriaca]MBF8192265.1 polysaccharide deacetylase family protein [Nonomuraea cypriaca]